MGMHSMLPPEEVSQNFISREEPSTVPCGQDTSFQHQTPMPFRFTASALDDVNKRHDSPKVVSPIYATTSSEVGQLGLQASDLPMRWYGRAGHFTQSWVAPPSTCGRTGLTTAIERSNTHHSGDQGWSGHLGLNDYGPNLHAASFVGRDPRSIASMPQ